MLDTSRQQSIYGERPYNAREIGNKAASKGVEEGQGREGYLKESLGILKTTEMKHRFMEREKAAYSVKRMCEVLKGIPEWLLGMEVLSTGHSSERE